MDRYRALVAAVSLWTVLIVCAALPSAHAGMDDLEITSVSKKFEQTSKSAATAGGVNLTKENWGYEVSVENKTFKDLTGLEIKYIMFYKQEELGSKAPPVTKHKEGTSKIDTVKGHEKAQFNTYTVELKKASLSGGYSYVDGAKPSAQDALTGLWVRVYQNGAQIAEYAKPSSLTTKEKWK